ncbi:prepilin peptidase [Candidatus Woesebacteria bacterium]|nr:prepilin peptidase [Candidatus Woesebacteria bacterium]
MLILLLCIIGLAIGSFLNVLIDRAPLDESILWGRSHCDYCKKPLRWFELIPLFSYMAQGGRCRRCHKSLRLQYPIVEGVNALLFGVIAWQFGPIVSVIDLVGLFGLLFFASAALSIVVADSLYQLIPDGSIMLIFISAGMRLASAPSEIIANLMSAVVAYAIFYFLWWITRGKGMGFGDVKLAGVLGLFLGFPDTILAFYIAFLTGAVVGVILILGRRAGMKTKIAFGPFLIFGAIATLLFSQPIYRLWFMFV